MLNEMTAIIGVGLEKCGTTTAHDILKLSEKISAPSRKETFYFNRDYIHGVSKYEELYKDQIGKKFHLDITPSYYHVPGTYERINKFFKNKLILLFLRDPIHRAISHYIHDIYNHKIESFPEINIPDFDHLSKFHNEYFVDLKEIIIKTKCAFHESELLIIYMQDIKNGKFIRTIEDALGEKLNVPFNSHISNESKPILFNMDTDNRLFIKRKNHPELKIDASKNQSEIISGFLRFCNLKKSITLSEYKKIKADLYSNIDYEQLGIDPKKIFMEKSYYSNL